MKPINKILNKPNQILGSLTKQALLNQYYTKIVQKYLNNPLNSDTLVTCYKNGNLTLATSNNSKLTLLKYALPELLASLRKDNNFIGLVNIKLTINKHPVKTEIGNNNLNKKSLNKNFLSEKASDELTSLSKNIKHNKLQEALLCLSKRVRSKEE